MNQEQAWQNTLRIAVYLLLFIILFGWLLKVAQSFLIPVLMSIISVYILATLTDWLGNFPVLKHSPEWMRRLMVLIGFIISMFAFSHILIITGEQILISAPNYQANLEKMLLSFSSRFSWAQGLDLSVLRELIFERISVQSFISYMIGAVSSFTSIVILIIVYAMFLIAEKGRFSSRLSLAFPSQGAERTKYLIMNINKKIGDYLAVKTLINIILATISVIILWLFGVEHAIFWALIIGILNYIPYVGSLLGVVFPVTLTLVQFGSIQMTLAVAVLLTMAQMYVGNVLEPKMIGKEINLSPFVVLISLSLWSSLWGISGAILAVPLTSVFVIIFAEFESTRPFTLLLMDDVEQDTDQA